MDRLGMLNVKDNENSYLAFVSEFGKGDKKVKVMSKILSEVSDHKDIIFWIIYTQNKRGEKFLLDADVAYSKQNFGKVVKQLALGYGVEFEKAILE